MGHLMTMILLLKEQLMLGLEKVQMEIKRNVSTYNIVVKLSPKQTDD
jgi:hypothetical protein